MKFNISQKLKWHYIFTCQMAEILHQDWIYRCETDSYGVPCPFFITRLQVKNLVSPPRIYSVSLEALAVLELPVIQSYNPKYIIPDEGFHYWENLTVPHYAKVPWINVPIVYETVIDLVRFHNLSI